LIQKLRGESVELAERAFACHVVTRASTGPRRVN